MSWTGSDVSFEHCTWIAYEGDLFIKIDNDMWTRSNTGYNESEIMELEERIGIHILRDFAYPYDTDDWGNIIQWDERVGSILAYDNDVSDLSISWTDDELQVLIGDVDAETHLLKLSHDRDYEQLTEISNSLENSGEFGDLYYDVDWGELGVSASTLTVSSSTSHSDDIVFHGDPDNQDLQMEIAQDLRQWLKGIAMDGLEVSDA